MRWAVLGRLLFGPEDSNISAANAHIFSETTPWSLGNYGAEAALEFAFLYYRLRTSSVHIASAEFGVGALSVVEARPPTLLSPTRISGWAKLRRVFMAQPFAQRRAITLHARNNIAAIVEDVATIHVGGIVFI